MLKNDPAIALTELVDDRIRKVHEKQLKEHPGGVAPMEVDADKNKGDDAEDDPLDDSQEERERAREVVN